MKIAVTGGSGFIGSHVVRQLKEEGHQVLVLDLQPPKVTGVLWKAADILRLDQLVEATRGVDVVYHLAAVSNVNVAYKDPSGCVEANIGGTANVLEAARVNSLQRVVFASTVWVYQAAKEKVANEETPLAPACVGHLYTASKIAGEMLCHSYWNLYKVPFTILRYGIPYGPGMRDELVIAIFMRKALANEPLTIQGDGKQSRKFIYVGDLAEGNVAALSPKAQNQTYNLDGDEQISILDTAQALKQIRGDVKIQFAPGRPGDYSGCETSYLKAQQELGWRPHTPFGEGLRRTYFWFLRQKEAGIAVAAAAGPRG